MKHDPDENTWNSAPGFIILLISGPAQCIFYLYFRLTNRKRLWFINRPAWLKADIGPTTLAPIVHLFICYYFSGSILSVILSGVGMSFTYINLVWADHFMPETKADSELVFAPSNINKSIDWGEVQVRCSGDFFPNSFLADCLAGGLYIYYLLYYI